VVSIRLSARDELDAFVRMERQPHAISFINVNELAEHQIDFENPKLVYLSIVNIRSELSGYFLLALEHDTNSVEFRRILIDQHQRGIGQLAITEMEAYCRNVLHCERVWLDVYADNKIGIHIYEKLGYTPFRDEIIKGRKLICYEKAL